MKFEHKVLRSRNMAFKPGDGDLQWCWRNLGAQYLNWYFEGGISSPPWGAFYFRKKEDAVHFALKWVE